MSVFSYFKETQAELRHVAWPTRVQTIVYTVLVIAVSVFVALYLGLFDFLFTTTLARLAGVAPAAAPTEQFEVTPADATTTPIDFTIPTDTE
jgi:preprotein translocase SecE subunit